jgi:hypothetical protein
VPIVQGLVVGQCVDLSHTYHQVSTCESMSENQQLIMDVRHWNNHRELYLAGCQREQVEPNKRVMVAVTEEEEGKKPKDQMTLEGWTVAKVPQWSREGLMEHIVELVVVDDQVRNLCNKSCTLKALNAQFWTVTRRPFPSWTVQPSVDSSCSNAPLPGIAISLTARPSPRPSIRKRKRSEIS